MLSSMRGSVRNRRRVGRRLASDWLGTGQGPGLESRFLTVPLFYQDLNQPFGQVESISSSHVFNCLDPSAIMDAEDDVLGDDGANAASQISNPFEIDPTTMGGQNSGGGGGTPQAGVTIRETGGITSSISRPADDPNSAGFQQISVVVSMINTDEVWANANGPYSPLNDPSDVQASQTTTTGTTTQLNWMMQDSNGGPASGTVSISFSVSFTSSADNRFTQLESLSLTSTHVNISISYNQGLRVTDPNTGDTVYSDPTWGTPDGAKTYSYTATFPVASEESLSYGSSLGTYAFGTFNNEYVAHTAEFDWNFSLTANP